MEAKFYENREIKKFQNELQVIYDTFEMNSKDSFFDSDLTSLSMVLVVHQSHHSLNVSYGNWVLETIKERTGVALNKEDLEKPFVDIANKFSNSVVKGIKKPWLGIKKVSTDTEDISINFISLVVENYLYQKGMFLSDPSLPGYKQHLDNEKEIFANNKIFFYLEDTVKAVSSYFDAYCLCVFLANRSLDTSARG